jgi:hypothetical protein
MACGESCDRLRQKDGGFRLESHPFPALNRKPYVGIWHLT